MTDDLQKNSTSTAITINIIVSLFLVAIKLAVGFITNSMAIFVSALDSLMDVGSSIVNLIASLKAAKPPDDDHAYGHGKIESLAALFQSTLIGFSGLMLLVEAVKRLIYGSRVENIPSGIAVMVAAMGVAGFLVIQMRFFQKKKRSLILETESLHYTTDVLTNGGVIIALVLVAWTGKSIWDLLISMLIALYIFKVASQILTHAVDELLDRSLPPVSMEQIEAIIRSYDPSIVGLHNFRSRQVGSQIFMDFHIEIRGESDFKKAHLMTEGLITRIQSQYPGSDVTVHYDPEGEF